MKIIITCCLLLPLGLFAQKKLNTLSSTELIQKGYAYHEKEAYYEAIQEYRKVSINDTNFATAQYEMALSYFGMEQYKQAQITLTELLDYDLRFDFKHSVYVLLGSAYDKNKETDKAIETYTEGIRLFPMQSSLYYNRAITYDGLKEYDKALADYKHSAQCNMYHASSHLRLGLMAANEGMDVQATLSLMTFLLLAPTDSRSSDVVLILESLADGSYEADKKNIQISEQGDIYEENNLFFENKVALQKNYKTKFTVDTQYGKQLHLMLKSIRYDKSNMDFWNQHYMPFYQEVWDQNKIDALVMLSIAGFDNAGIQKKLTAKKKVLSDFIAWATPAYKNAISNQYMDFEGSKQFVSVDYETEYLNYIGKIENDIPKGLFVYYHPNGSLKMNAHFDNEGNTDGTWELFNMYNGKIERKIAFANKGTEKTLYQYYYSGELSDKYRMVNGLVQDTVYSYYRNGTPKEKYTMVDGQKSGRYLSYYPNGTVSYDLLYKNNLLEGKFIGYHLNGQKQDEFDTKADKIEGKRLRYYSTGQLLSEYNYKADLYDGPYTEYFPDGKIKQTGAYKNGKQINTMTEYFANGGLSTVVTLDESGKENGMSTFYDYDGKKYHELQFSKGDLTAITFIDKTGKSTEVAAKKGKKLDYVLNYPSGITKAKGSYLDSKKTGKWSYFDNYGNLIRTENYKDDVISDTMHSYFSNGQLESITVFENGMRNGIYLSYNIFGELVEEGTYVNDEYDKEWYGYYNDGSLKSENYFVNGTKNGIQKSYAVNGKLISREEFDVGREVTHIFLDTNEKIADEFGEYNGNILLHNPTNTYVNFNSNYTNGNADGPISWLYPDLTPNTKGQFINSQRSGDWKWYYKDGKLHQEMSYISGEITGENKIYFENGKPSSIHTYVNGEKQGPYKLFHENGTLITGGSFTDGNRHGKSTYYSPQGAVALIRNYDQDVIVSYTYLDNEGKEVPPIMLDKQDLKVVAYFKNGKKSNEHTRKNGLVEGPYFAYHDNGQKWEEENYLHGEAHGKFYAYNETGQKVYEADYQYGDLHGKEIYFYPNGKIKSEKSYLLGNAHGTHTEYSPEGKVTFITLYYNDEIVSIQKF